MTRSLQPPRRGRRAVLPALAAAALGLSAACGAPGGDAASPRRPALTRPALTRPRVVVVSIDGMKPETYREPDRLGLAVPTLRAIAARGAHARAVESVFPSVTYPAHTTLVTGAPPRVHGIVSNQPLDPLRKNLEGWRWYSEDIAVPTLYTALEAQGGVAALITWPVTVGAKATFVVPEYWRSGHPDDQKLLRSLSTPGLLDRVSGAYPDLWKYLVPPEVKDEAQFAIARYLLAHERPDLLLLHVWQTDDAQHASGPGSPEARQAFEHVDRLLGELLAELERSPDWGRTTLVVLSDHGFAPAEHEIRLNALFRERGLVTTDADGKVTAARAASIENGGTAYVYALDPAARAELLAAAQALGPAVARIYSRDELVAAGGDPAAAFALAAAPGYSFTGRTDSPALAARPGRGHHGLPPTDPAMAASFLAIGPRIAHRDLGMIRMIDIAPTIAGWLGIALAGATGAPIPGI